MIFKYWKLYPMEFGNLKSKIKCFSLVENYYPMKFRYLKSLNLWFSKVENYYPMKFRNLKSWNLWISKVEKYYPMKFRNLKSWNLWFSELEKLKKSKWEHCTVSQIWASSGHDVMWHHMMPHDLTRCPETSPDVLTHQMYCHTRTRRRWLQLLLLYLGLPYKCPLVNTNRVVKRKDTLYFNTFFNLIIF